MARSIICIVVEKIRCGKYFVRLIFVALCGYENFSTTKISRFTVYSMRNDLIIKIIWMHAILSACVFKKYMHENL